ncbi:hypothetical protein BV22DRAFT_1188491, partial [Leucogyrophana mollusca]
SSQALQLLAAIEDTHKSDRAFQNFRIKLANYLNDALPCHGIPLPNDRRIKLVPADTISEFRYLWVNYESKVDWRLATDHLRCSPDFYNASRYDCVLYQVDANSFAFARLIFIFKRCVGRPDSNPHGAHWRYDTVRLDARDPKEHDQDGPSERRHATEAFSLNGGYLPCRYGPTGWRPPPVHHLTHHGSTQVEIHDAFTARSMCALRPTCGIALFFEHPPGLDVGDLPDCGELWDRTSRCGVGQPKVARLWTSSDFPEVAMSAISFSRMSHPNRQSVLASKLSTSAPSASIKLLHQRVFYFAISVSFSTLHSVLSMVRAARSLWAHAPRHYYIRQGSLTALPCLSSIVNPIYNSVFPSPISTLCEVERTRNSTQYLP